jgi:hypothetical protein
MLLPYLNHLRAGGLHEAWCESLDKVVLAQRTFWKAVPFRSQSQPETLENSGTSVYATVVSPTKGWTLDGTVASALKG